MAIAKGAGFSFSADDINKAQSELSEEELEGVAGAGTKGQTCGGCTINSLSFVVSTFVVCCG